MANQNGRNGSSHEKGDDKDSWRSNRGDFPSVRRDDEDRYRMRDDDERFERGSGSHWEDRDRGYGEPRGNTDQRGNADQRDTERRGMGQSGYGAGRSSDDRSMGTQVRNTAWSGTHGDRGMDDRWTGRGNEPWSAEDRNERQGDRQYGRGGWEEGRIGMSQGYGYQDGDRPSFERGMHDPRFGSGSREQRSSGPGAGGYGGGGGGPYGGGGYEPDARSYGNREQNRHGAQGYGGEGRMGYGEDRGAFSRDQGGYRDQGPYREQGGQRDQGAYRAQNDLQRMDQGGGYRQHQTGFGGAQGLDLKRGPHRGKGPKGFEHNDDRIRERVCEALSDDHNIDATNIEVSVHKGEVTLTGTIDDRDTKRLAEDCVLQCSGVRDVHNQLRVRG